MVMCVCMEATKRVPIKKMSICKFVSIKNKLRSSVIYECSGFSFKRVPDLIRLTFLSEDLLTDVMK